MKRLTPKSGGGKSEFKGEGGRVYSCMFKEGNERNGVFLGWGGGDGDSEFFLKINTLYIYKVYTGIFLTVFFF